MAALTWMLIETLRVGKPSALGFATGAIAGLAGITPAAGTVGPVGAIAIGFVAGTLGYVAATSLKFRFRYDDALDVVGVHGVGGFVGIVMLAVFSSTAFGGSMVDLNIPRQLGVQLLGGLFTVVYTVIVTVVILKVVDLVVGLRVGEHEEVEGLDLAEHGEVGYRDI